MNKDQINLGVAGNPVSHSLSPELFKKYIEGHDLKFCYTRLLANTVSDIYRLINAYDIKGINITSPFKESILDLSDELSPYVKFTGAANTLLLKGKTKSLYNTDISGVQMPLTRILRGERAFSALVIGAGGAAKAAIKALKNLNVSTIFITNRTKSKADALADQFGIISINKPQVSKYAFDIIINTTSECPEILSHLLISENTILYDAYYKKRPMEEIANNYNSQYLSGLDWLSEQGRVSYALMTGISKTDFYCKQINNDHGKIKRIALIGMMGTGKSTIGKRLAEKLGYDFADMDKMIQDNEGLSITRIFETKGEAFFRKLEKDLLKNIIKRENIVISTGGGIIVDEENIVLLKEKCWNILLYGSAENLSRIASDKNRPLLAGKDKIDELNKIFNERKNKYYKTSDIVVCSDTDSYHNISEFIYDDYSKSFLH
ncbi:MAG: shikimate kinase [Deltaproteobacteria bacterium]